MGLAVGSVAPTGTPAAVCPHPPSLCMFSRPLLCQCVSVHRPSFDVLRCNVCKLIALSFGTINAFDGHLWTKVSQVSSFGMHAGLSVRHHKAVET